MTTILIFTELPYAEGELPKSKFNVNQAFNTCCRYEADIVSIYRQAREKFATYDDITSAINKVFSQQSYTRFTQSDQRYLQGYAHGMRALHETLVCQAYRVQGEYFPLPAYDNLIARFGPEITHALDHNDIDDIYIDTSNGVKFYR